MDCFGLRWWMKMVLLCHKDKRETLASESNQTDPSLFLQSIQYVFLFHILLESVLTKKF